MINNRKRYILAIFCVLYEFVTYLSNDTIMPGMRGIVLGFNGSESQVALSLTYYILGGSTLQLFLAPLLPVFGKRKMLLLGNVFFLVCSMWIPFSSSIDQFLLARYMQGMGMSFIFIGYAYINDLFNDEEAVKLFSILANVAMLAPLLGPVVGAVIIGHFSWHYVFVLSVVIGFISLVGIWKSAPVEAPHTMIRLDIKNVFIAYKDILVSDLFLIGAFASNLAMVPMVAWVGVSPNIIMGNLHMDIWQYSYSQLMVFGGLAVSSILIQKVAGKMDVNRIIIIGSLFFMFGLFAAFVFNHILVLMLCGMFIYSFGLGLFTGTISRMVVTSIKVDTGYVTAVFNVANTLILATGVEVYNHIGKMNNYSLASYTQANIVVAVVSFSALYIFAQKVKTRKWE